MTTERETELSHRARWGLAAAVQKALVSRLRWWFGLRIYGIYARPVALPEEPDPVVPGYSHRLFEEAQAEELIACSRDPELDLPESFIRDALAKGDICDAILHDGRAVSYRWSAFTPTHDDSGVYVRFDEGYRYGYKTYTLPQYRGRHLLGGKTRLTEARWISRGCASAIAFVAIDNRSSIRRALVMGSRRVGFAGYLKRGGIFLPFRTPGVRRCGVSFFMP